MICATMRSVEWPSSATAFHQRYFCAIWSMAAMVDAEALSLVITILYINIAIGSTCSILN
jgi:hypothetical protein